jgi:hypothetical protein
MGNIFTSAVQISRICDLNMSHIYCNSLTFVGTPTQTTDSVSRTALVK